MAYSAVEGVLSYDQYRYKNREIMIFGEYHNDTGCSSAYIPFLVLLKHLLDTSNGIVDIFIETPKIRKSTDVTKKNALSQIERLENHKFARFHWIDIRYIKHSAFLEVLSEAQYFLRVGMPLREIKEFVKFHIQPLVDEKHPLLDAIFQSVKIDKQLGKIESDMAKRIREYYQNGARKLAKNIMQHDWFSLLQKARRADATNDKKLGSEIYMTLFGKEKCKWKFAEKTIETCVLYALQSQAEDIALKCMDAYVTARLFKPYVQKAIVIVGYAHVRDIELLFDQLVDEEHMEHIAEDERPSITGKNCTYVNQPIRFST